MGLVPKNPGANQPLHKNHITGTVSWAWKRHLNDYYPKYRSWTPIQAAERAELDALLLQVNETGSMDAAMRLWQRINQGLLERGSIRYSEDSGMDSSIKARLWERIEGVKSEEEASAISREMLIRYANFYQDKIMDHFRFLERYNIVKLNRANFIGAGDKFGGIFARLNSRLSASEVLLTDLSLEDALKKNDEADKMFSKLLDNVSWGYLHLIAYSTYKSYRLGPERQKPDQRRTIPMQPVPLISPGEDEEMPEYDLIRAG